MSDASPRQSNVDRVGWMSATRGRVTSASEVILRRRRLVAVKCRTETFLPIRSLGSHPASVGTDFAVQRRSQAGRWRRAVGLVNCSTLASSAWPIWTAAGVCP